MKKILILSTSLILAGCSAASIDGPKVPRQEPTTVNYHPGMRVNVDRTHIDRKGNIISMYDPVVYCITEHYPGKKPERVCRIVK